ncbi:glycoside hydrolase [Romboutsia lituseburensis]|uniref:Glycosyl hydrolases related to GH101 family, GHL1-GHL3 n=1 Tax=Romboutsia lituseburensis DSM 797 TaxID=1121325 RepID=A0A1G9IL17_9FIRM|nr:glycoside hydrolase [Romboutsia lituseburensis]CEH33860.1 Lipoprotein [Romboutsia lituseburensis]SDL25574.1 Glycosyl hydrolases related to GH101 family, GHL1-GHL3 [Romboutsia lituseburensis DSM 797]
MIKRKKIISTILSVIMVGGVISGCSNKDIGKTTAKKEEVKNLDFTFDVNPENFEVTVNSNNKTEQVSMPQEKREVTNLKKSENKVSWTYPKENLDVSIEKDNNHLDVDIKSNNKEENSFTWPSVSGESYTLPLQEGKFIPSNDKYWKEFLNDQVYNVLENFSMQFFSVNKSNYALTYIIKNKYNNDIKFDTKNDINFSFKHEYPSINKNKEYGFEIYITDNNVVDIAKTYKNYVVEKGEFKTLEEKAKENKNIEKLYGAPQIYFWEKSAITESDIKWQNLKSSISPELESWIKELLTTKVEDGKEAAKVFDDIKKQDYIDKYQKNQIVSAFNSMLQLKEFYNQSIFKNTNSDIDSLVKKGVGNLNKVELVKLNKMLLKSELKDSTINVNEWSKHNTLDLIDEMKKSGMDNAWIGFDDIEAGYVSPEFVKKAEDYGYLVAPYDSYHSIHKPGEEKWSTATFEDKSLYENATVENKKGKKYEGFQGTGRKLNPTLSLPSVKDRVSKVMENGYGFNSWFIDCDATGEIYDDYSKNHITTQEQDLKARLERMSYIRDEKNMVIGSEGGNDFASTTVAFAHGLETPAFSWVDPDMNKNKDSKYYVGRYYSKTGGVPEVFAKQVPVKEKYKKVFLDSEYSIPLFRLVYNDSVITSYHWLWGIFKIQDEVNNRMMREILYNTPPMYHIDRNEWDKYKNEIKEHNEVWSAFNKKAIKEEMTDFKILSDDKLVQMSQFGDDLKVVANFSDKEFKYENDNVKPHSLIIYDKNEKTIYQP